MSQTVRAALAAALLAVLPAAAAAQYTAKEVDAAPPNEIKEPVRKLLGQRSVQVLDAKNTVLCEIWFRKEIPVKATAAQVKNGLTYREVPETTLLAVMKVAETMTDYRKQKIKPGLYTLRLAFQPQDGDHMGTAPHAEFVLAVPQGQDKGAPTLEPKELHELSMKAPGTSHPGVFLLFPQKTAAEPKMVDKSEGHWALTLKLDVLANGAKAALFIGLTLIGVSSAA